jgi:hypothetical protein
MPDFADLGQRLANLKGLGVGWVLASARWRCLETSMPPNNPGAQFVHQEATSSVILAKSVISVPEKPPTDGARRAL